MRLMLIPLCGLFFLIATLYSMAGFGGGSSYLAVLVLAGFPYQSIAPVALACNLIVSGTGFVNFYRAGYLKWKNVLPFAVLSVPMAYWGGSLPISKGLFSLLLGLSLIVVAFRMLFVPRPFEGRQSTPESQVWKIGLPVGGVIGFLSGLVGIGGGIFLSPVLLLLGWANAKEAAAAASIFIFLNSAAGLLGHAGKAAVDLNRLWPLALAVFWGGHIGSRMGSAHLPKKVLERILAVLVLCASYKLLRG